MEGSMSIATYEDGGEVPPARIGAVWYVPSLLVRSREHVPVSTGLHCAAGSLGAWRPVPDFVYRCFEWQPCEIRDMEGTTLQDGDRLLAAS